jgi:hypothetical protein
MQWHSVWSIGIALVASYAFGQRGWGLAIWAVALWFPSAVIIEAIAVRMFATKLEAWDGRRIS